MRLKKDGSLNGDITLCGKLNIKYKMFNIVHEVLSNKKVAFELESGDTLFRSAGNVMATHIQSRKDGFYLKVAVTQDVIWVDKIVFSNEYTGDIIK